MIIVGKAILSDDLRDKQFVCDLEKCKGACCVEGDLGAPLEKEELTALEDIKDRVLPHLSEEGRKEILQQGPWILDREGEYSTPTIKGRECAYAIYDEKGILKCGIEKAYQEGDINFKKPISCHLYPIRITRYDEYEALNYDRWQICNPACSLGEALKVPVYKFLKDALIRKYGENWYRQLEMEIAVEAEK